MSCEFSAFGLRANEDRYYGTDKVYLPGEPLQFLQNNNRCLLARGSTLLCTFDFCSHLLLTLMMEFI